MVRAKRLGRVVVGIAFVVAAAACASFRSSPSPGAEADAAVDDGSSLGKSDVAGGAAADAGNYPEAVLADKPLLYLRLGERSGILAVDSSGHGKDGAYLGNVTQGLPGATADTDTAVRFGLVNWDAEKVRVTPALDFTSQAPFSLEAWVKPETDGDGAFSGIVGRGGWSLFTQYDVGWIKFTRADVDGGWDGPWFTTKLPRDHFTHVVGTYDGTMMRLYIDGLDVGQASSTREIAASTDAILIGPHFPGLIDEVAVYDHALSADRVRAHHQKGIGQ